MLRMSNGLSSSSSSRSSLFGGIDSSNVSMTSTFKPYGKEPFLVAGCLGDEIACLGGVLPTRVGDDGMWTDEALADRLDRWVDFILVCRGQWAETASKVVMIHYRISSYFIPCTANSPCHTSVSHHSYQPRLPWRTFQTSNFPFLSAPPPYVSAASPTFLHSSSNLLPCFQA
jgi:hypothetical protein